MTFEDRLRMELRQAGDRLPVVGIDLVPTLTRARSARRRSIALQMAAAAAVATIAAGVMVLTRSGEIERLPSNPAGAPTTTTPQATPSERGGATVGSEAAEPVVREWLQAIRDSEDDRAWSLMTPAAQAEVGRARFDQMMAGALPEGLGAFADASGFSLLMVDGDRGDARAVSVLWGEVTREGMTEFATMALPVLVRDDVVLVDDPIIDRARYGDRTAVFASESAGPFEFHAGDELVVEFSRPEGIVEVYIGIDDAEDPLPTRFDPRTGVAAATLGRDLEEGPHIATLVVVHRSGRLYPEAIMFTAASP